MCTEFNPQTKNAQAQYSFPNGALPPPQWGRGSACTALSKRGVQACRGFGLHLPPRLPLAAPFNLELPAPSTNTPTPAAALVAFASADRTSPHSPSPQTLERAEASPCSGCKIQEFKESTLKSTSSEKGVLLPRLPSTAEVDVCTHKQRSKLHFRTCSPGGACEVGSRRHLCRGEGMAYMWPTLLRCSIAAKHIRASAVRIFCATRLLTYLPFQFSCSWPFLQHI